MEKRKAFIFICAMVTCAAFLFAAGCRSKEEPVKITISVEGEEFSDAEMAIDGQSAGHFTQTLVKSNGELYIDGSLVTTLPPDSPQRTKEDTWSGSTDSITLKPGVHAIVLQTSEGKSLEITGTFSSGYHLITYFPDDGTLRCDGESIPATPGTPISIKAKTRSK
ncbi:MAG TPA: hypothetical protein VMT62_09165 [Syntrophorhabdaceae bacterium]|nr:hypothetical protein [Syntrophorhabdaceae bacterium]